MTVFEVDGREITAAAPILAAQTAIHAGVEQVRVVNRNGAETVAVDRNATVPGLRIALMDAARALGYRYFSPDPEPSP